MNKTKIEWVKNPDGTQGYTWNPITGCLNGCEYCYARKLANGRLKPLYLANKNLAPYLPSLRKESNQWESDLDPFYPRFWYDRIYAPCQIKKPSGVFVCDMGELFGDWIPDLWQHIIFETIQSCPQHRFYLLTKQPQNLIKFSPFPDNCWVGVTATNHLQFVASAIWLREVKAKVKYISIEPLLGWMPDLALSIVDTQWLIIGAQTNPYKPPKIGWVEEIVKSADKAGIPVFLKENLVPMIADSLDPKKMMLYPDGMHLKQEMPK